MIYRTITHSKHVWVLIFLSFSGCATFNDIFNPSEKYPVVLYVQGNGRLINPLNVIVTMDSDTILNKNFYIERSILLDDGRILDSDGPKMDVLNLTLTKGTHQITAESINGNAGLDIVFTVEKPLWLFLDYWGKNHFQLNISERPMGFAYLKAQPNQSLKLTCKPPTLLSFKCGEINLQHVLRYIIFNLNF